MRVPWIPSSVPLFVLLVAALGQVKEQVAVVALAIGGIVLVWDVGLIAILVFHLVRKSSAVGVLVGLVVSLAALLALAALVVEAPLWVRWRAAPAIAAIEQLHARDGHYPSAGSLEGDFPSPVRAVLEGADHCIYKPRGASYHLTCLGVPFTKCGYDGATGRWSGWE
jgi:hypothetical protein